MTLHSSYFDYTEPQITRRQSNWLGPILPLFASISWVILDNVAEQIGYTIELSCQNLTFRRIRLRKNWRGVITGTNCSTNPVYWLIHSPYAIGCTDSSTSTIVNMCQQEGLLARELECKNAMPLIWQLQVFLGALAECSKLQAHFLWWAWGQVDSWQGRLTDAHGWRIVSGELQ